MDGSKGLGSIETERVDDTVKNAENDGSNGRKKGRFRGFVTCSTTEIQDTQHEYDVCACRSIHLSDVLYIRVRIFRLQKTVM